MTDDSVTRALAAADAGYARAAARGIYAEVADPEREGRYHSGWGVIVPGHDHDPAVIEALLDDDYERVIIEVQHVRYVPRVKWCSNHDGFGCDNEGDWHGHWFGVKHNPAATPTCCHTVAIPVYASP